MPAGGVFVTLEDGLRAVLKVGGGMWVEWGGSGDAVRTPHPALASLVSARSRKGRGDCGRESSEVGMV